MSEWYPYCAGALSFGVAGVVKKPLSPDGSRMTRKMVAMLVVTAVLAALFGGYTVRYFYGEDVATTFMKLRQQGLASDIKLRVKLLEYIQIGEDDKALKMSEALLDSDLISLSGYLEYIGEPIDPHTMESLGLAKRYRERFPSSSENQEINTQFEKLFKLVK